MSDYKLAIKIAGELDSSLRSAVTDAQNMLDGLNGGKGKGTAEKIFGGIASGAKTLAKSSLASLGLIGAGAIKVGKDAVTVGTDFESAMAALASTAGVEKASESYTMLEEAARNVGATTNKTSTEAANALQYMALAGWGTVDSVDALEDMVKLSSATNTDLATTSDLVTDSMGALGLGMQDYAGYMDMVAAADSAANYSSTEFMETMIGAGGAARQLGVNINDLGTAAGILANNGTKGVKAGTALNSMFMRLAGNDKAISTMQDLGISLYDANDQFVGMENVLQQVNSAMAGMDAATANKTMKDLFGTNYASEAKYLLDSVAEGGAWESLSSNLEQAQQGIDEFGNTFDTLDQKYQTMTDTLTGDIDRLKSAYASLGEDIYKNIVGDEGTGLRGAVQQMTEYVGQLKEAFSTDGAEGIATALGDMIGDISDKIATDGAQAITDAQQFASNLISSLGSEDNSESIGAAASTIITGLSTSFLDYTGDFAVAAGNIMQGITTALAEDDVGAKIGDAASGMVTKIGDWFSQNGGEFGLAAGKLISSLAQGLADHADDLIGGGIKLIGGLAKGLILGAGEILSNLPEIVGAIIEGVVASIPELLHMGAELAMALKDGFVNAIEGLGEWVFGGDVSINPDVNYDSEDYASQIAWEVMDQEGSRFNDLSMQAQDFYSVLADGSVAFSEFNEAVTNQDYAGLAEMINVDPETGIDNLESFMIAAHEAGAAWIKDCNDIYNAEMEAAGGTDEMAEVVQETANNTEDSLSGIDEKVNELAASYENAATDIGNTDFSSTMDADALSTMIQSIDEGTIGQVTEQFNSAMTEMTTSANTAATSVTASMALVSASFAGMAVAVGLSNAGVLISCGVTAAGITSAFASIDLSSIASNMMAGLTNGITAGGAAAIAAAQSVASQIASIMASTVKVSSPSRVTYEIGDYIGQGLEEGINASAPGVYDASEALADTAISGPAGTLTNPLQAFNTLAGVPAQSTTEASGGIVFSPQITIAGNASESDVRNALAWSMSEFERMYDRLMKDRRRTSFA